MTLSRWTALLAIGLGGASPVPGIPQVPEVSSATVDVDGCDPTPAPDRDAVLQTAREYLDLRWVARPENLFHGFDTDGVRVDTADADHVRGGWTRGDNLGMPYSWGGFDTPGDFQSKLIAGYVAGNVPRSMQAHRSRLSAGVDCSGLISRAWALPHKYSTKQLAAVSARLEAFADLLPGDILLNIDPGRHVMLFERFTRPDRSEVQVIEAGVAPRRPGFLGWLHAIFRSDPSWRVIESTYPVAELERIGFAPYEDRRRIEAPLP